jgi:hypothetical protein
VGSFTASFTATEAIYCHYFAASQVVCLHTSLAKLKPFLEYPPFNPTSFYESAFYADGSVIYPSSLAGTSIYSFASTNLSSVQASWNQQVAAFIATNLGKVLVRVESLNSLSSLAYAVSKSSFGAQHPVYFYAAYYEDYLIAFFTDERNQKTQNFLILMGCVFLLMVVNYFVLCCCQRSVIHEFIKEIETITFKLRGANLNELDVDLNVSSQFKEIDELRNSLQRIVILRRVLCPEFYDNRDQLLLRYQQSLAEFERCKDFKRMGIIKFNNGLLNMLDGDLLEGSRLLEYSVELLETQYSEVFEIPNIRGYFESKAQLKQLRKFFVGHSEDLADLLEVYSARTYALALCLVRLDEAENSKERRGEAIRLFQKVCILEEGKFNERELEALFHILTQHLQLEHKEEASAFLRIIREKITVYQHIYELFLDQEKHIPPEIFLQRFEFMIGKYYRERVMDNHHAVEHFKNAIEVGRFYDKKLRVRTLRMLEQIYIEEQMGCGFVDKLLKTETRETSNNKDVVFLLDFSHSMERTRRKYYAVKLILELIRKHLHPDCCVALITFNYKVETIFELIRVGEHRELIESAILKLGKEPAAGETALYQAIYEGLNELSKNDSPARGKIMLCLSDGADNCSPLNIQKIGSYIKAYNNPEAHSDLPNPNLTLSFLGFELVGQAEKAVKELSEMTDYGSYMKATFELRTDVLFCAQMINSISEEGAGAEEHLNLEEL